jgi:ATP-dependent Clp protease adaptor protein ClpS
MVSPGKKSKKSVETSDKKGEVHVLILHNDNVNTFEYVIDTLCEVCKHNLEQAEQCAMITHYKGKCDIKKGPFNELKPLKDALLERKLSVTID